MWPKSGLHKPQAICLRESRGLRTNLKIVRMTSTELLTDSDSTEGQMEKPLYSLLSLLSSLSSLSKQRAVVIVRVDFVYESSCHWQKLIHTIRCQWPSQRFLGPRCSCVVRVTEPKLSRRSSRSDVGCRTVDTARAVPPRYQ